MKKNHLPKYPTLKLFMMSVAAFAVFISCNHPQAQSESVITINSCRYSTKQIGQLIAQLPTDSTEIILIGNSLLSRANWSDLLGTTHLSNWGLGGDEIPCIRDRAMLLAGHRTRFWIIEAGINDLQIYSSDTIYQCFRDIIRIGKKTGAEVILNAVISVSRIAGSHENGRKEYKEVNQLVSSMNQQLRMIAKEEGAIFLDINNPLTLQDGTLQDEYTTDGVHLSDNAYRIWADSISTIIH
jgi:lysophospholipase L1-like esterase